MIWYKTAQETETGTEDFDTVVLAAKDLVKNNSELFPFIDKAAKELQAKGLTLDKKSIIELAKQKVPPGISQKSLIAPFQQALNTLNRMLNSAPMAGIEDLNKRQLEMPNFN